MAAPHPPSRGSTLGLVEEYLTSQGASLADPCSGTCAKKLPDWKDVLASLGEVCRLNGAFKSAFSKATSNRERLRLVRGDDVISKQMNEHVTLLLGTLTGNDACICHSKDEATSALEHANCLVDYCDETFHKETRGEKRRHLAMFKLLTYGLMRAPHLSEAAARLYDKRAVASFDLRQLDNSFEDGERLLACEGTQESPALTNYLLRKAVVLLVLGKLKEAAAFLASRPAGTPPAGTPEGDAWEKMIVDSTGKGRIDGNVKRTVPLSKFHDTLPVIEGLVKADKFKSHGRFPWLNAKLDLTFDALKGRFQLRSREKLEYGDIVAIGKPFASLGSFQLKSVLDKCHHCSLSFPRTAYEGVHEDDDEGNAMLAIQGLFSGPARMPSAIPCTDCPNAVYCSEACRAEAWTLYHRFECSQLLALHKLKPAAHLALRMLYSAGSLEKIKQVTEKWDTVQDKLELIDSSRAYAFIYSMRQPEICDFEEEFEHTVTALYLATLAMISGFVTFSGDNLKIAADILLRHLRQIKANVYFPREAELQPEDASLSCLASTMDFSCEPTIGCKSLFEGGSMLSNVAVFYAARVVDESSQLTLAYPTPCQLHYLVSSFDGQSSRALASYKDRRLERLALQMLTTFGGDGRYSAIASQFGIICKCTRCQLEQADSLSNQTVIYLPIACPLCGAVMTRSKSDPSYFVCSTTACTGQMSFSQMSLAYREILHLTRTTLPALLAPRNRFEHLNEEEAFTLTRALTAALSPVVPLLSRTSSHLALLYSRLSIQLVHFSGARHRHLNVTLLKEACLYADKSLRICKSLDGGRGFILDNGPVVNCLNIASLSVGSAIGRFMRILEDICDCPAVHRCLIQQELHGFVRLESAKKRTAYDLMLTEAKFVSYDVAYFEKMVQMAG